MLMHKKILLRSQQYNTKCLLKRPLATKLFLFMNGSFSKVISTHTHTHTPLMTPSCSPTLPPQVITK